MPIIIPFPIYGLLFGINYISSETDEELAEENSNIVMIQIALGFIGFSIIW